MGSRIAAGVFIVICQILISLPAALAAADPVILTLVGDCTLGSDESFGYDGTLPQVIDSHYGDPGYLFRHVYDIFASDDLTVINLEGALTDSMNRQAKQFAFKGPPRYAGFLSYAKIEAANVANNHTYDYGEEGYRDTLAALTRENILAFGDGVTGFYHVRGRVIGLIGCYGCNGDEGLAQLQKEIRAVKAVGGFAVVSFHWGQEGHYYPDDYQRYYAYKAIELGADLIVGHHPHVLQGLEVYRGRLIAYSLGNFAFGGNGNPADKRTMILQLRIHSAVSGIFPYDVRILPARVSSEEYVNNYQPTLYRGEKKEAFWQWYESLSEVRIRDEWQPIS